MITKTLYLDFDGVLHTHSQIDISPFNRLSLLEDALVGQAVQIVISSSWRMHHEFDALRAFCGRLAPQVVDRTGGTILGSYSRHREILEHADWNGVIDWRALDDSMFEFPEDEHRLVWCDPRVGVDVRQIQALQAWIDDLEPVMPPPASRRRGN